MTQNWKTARSIRAASRLAPHTPGVYALGLVERESGLIVAPTWMYVGRATTSLSRRLSQHRTVDERNVALRNWMASIPAGFEVWFSSTTDAGAAVAIERRLIGELDPPFNTLLRPRLSGRPAA